MGLGELVSEITSAGEAEARKIRKEAEAEAQEVLNEAKAEAGRIHAKWMDRAKEEAEAEERRIIASAELEAKKLRLAAEADVLQHVRSAVEGRLENLSTAERQEITRSLYKSVDVPSGGRAWALEEDKDLVQELGFEYAGPIEGPGGLIIEDPAGDTREDLRFETVLDETWRSVVREIASDLFKE